MEDFTGPPSILSKAFEILRAFTTKERVMTLTQLTEATGLSKSSVHRLLLRLMELGAIEQNPRGYKIGIDLLQIGAKTPAAGLRDMAMSHLADLHLRTHQTVHLAVLRKFDIVYLTKLEAGDTLSALSGIGARLPANCSALGKVLLAYEDLAVLRENMPTSLSRMTPASLTDPAALIAELRQVRSRGIACEEGETQRSLACIASPVLVSGVAVGAVSVAYQRGAVLSGQVETALRNTTTRIAIDASHTLSERTHWHQGLDPAALNESWAGTVAPDGLKHPRQSG